jgi:hypothetical protein
MRSFFWYEANFGLGYRFSNCKKIFMIESRINRVFCNRCEWDQSMILFGLNFKYWKSWGLVSFRFFFKADYISLNWSDTPSIPRQIRLDVRNRLDLTGKASTVAFGDGYRTGWITVLFWSLNFFLVRYN